MSSFSPLAVRRTSADLWIAPLLLTTAVIVATGTALGGIHVVAAVTFVVVLAACTGWLAFVRPDLWLCAYVAAILLSPDPHFDFLGVQVAVHLGDVAFLAAVPAFIAKTHKWQDVHVGVGLFLLTSGVSLVMAFANGGEASGAAALLRWLRLIEAVFPLYFASCLATSSTRALRSFEMTFLAAALLSISYGIAQFVLGFDLGFLGIQYGAHYLFLEDGIRLRAVGLLNEASGFGTLSSLLIWVAVYLLAQKENSRARQLLCTVAIPVGLIGLILSYTRAPFVALAFALVLFGLRSGVATTARVLGGLAVALVVAAVVAPQWLTLFSDRLLPTLSTSGDVSIYSSGRTDNWSLIISQFSDRPVTEMVFGTGYKSLALGTVVQSSYAPRIVGDNQFLTTLVEQGPLGLVAMLVMIALVARSLTRKLRAPESRVRVWAWLLLLWWISQVLLQMPFVDYLTYFRILPILFAAIGLVVTSFDPPDTRGHG